MAERALSSAISMLAINETFSASLELLAHGA
jgi:hypothetical protein